MKIRKLLSCTIIIILIILFFIIGILIPKYFISDGIENFEGEEKEFAKFALDRTNYWGNLIQRKMRLKLKVIHVEKIGEGKCALVPNINSKYIATVGCYTLFGIPTEYVCIPCERI